MSLQNHKELRERKGESTSAEHLGPVPPSLAMAPAPVHMVLPSFMPSFLRHLLLLSFFFFF